MAFASGMAGNWGSFGERRSWRSPNYMSTSQMPPTGMRTPGTSSRRAARGWRIRWLYERLPEAFLFSATWGPVTIDERDIDRAELLTVVESNAISTGTVYKVRPA